MVKPCLRALPLRLARSFIAPGRHLTTGRSPSRASVSAKGNRPTPLIGGGRDASHRASRTLLGAPTQPIPDTCSFARAAARRRRIRCRIGAALRTATTTGAISLRPMLARVRSLATTVGQVISKTAYSRRVHPMCMVLWGTRFIHRIQSLLIRRGAWPPTPRIS